MKIRNGLLRVKTGMRGCCLSSRSMNLRERNYRINWTWLKWELSGSANTWKLRDKKCRLELVWLKGLTGETWSSWSAFVTQSAKRILWLDFRRNELPKSRASWSHSPNLSWLFQTIRAFILKNRKSHHLSSLRERSRLSWGIILLGSSPDLFQALCLKCKSSWIKLTLNLR